MIWSSRVSGISVVEITRLSCLQFNIHFDRPERHDSLANKCVHTNFLVPHPMHTKHAIWMLEEQGLGLVIFGTCFASTHFGLGGLSKMKMPDRLYAPAKRIRSCKNFAVVAGMFMVGWYDMMVLPLIFRMRCTDRRSKTRRRWSIKWC